MPTLQDLMYGFYAGTTGLPGGGGSGTVADATNLVKGVVLLAGDLGGTASAPTVPGLANKVDKTITINGQPLSSNVNITPTNLGLGNVDNTRDINKTVAAANKLANPVAINGVSFDGTQSVTVSNPTLFAANAANFTAVANTLHRVDATAAPVVATLPAGLNDQQITIFKIDGSTNPVTISGTINGVAASIVLTVKNTGKTLIADGTGNWYTIAGDVSVSQLDTRYSPSTVFPNLAGQPMRFRGVLTATALQALTNNQVWDIAYVYGA